MSDDLGSIVHAINCVNLVHNLEIGMQFPDSENAQHNLAIAQIPRLRGTSACTEV